jgi:hypothetical protein
VADLPRHTIGRRADLPALPEIAAELTAQTASCTLPTGETITVSHRLPLYTLARELDAKGYGDYRLQSYTPTGTPGLRGLVSVMAGLTVSDRDKGSLRLEKYRPFDRRGGLVQRDPALEGTPPPQTAALASESTAA